MRKSELARKMREQARRDPGTYSQASAVLVAVMWMALFGGPIFFTWLVGDLLWGGLLFVVVASGVYLLLARLRRTAEEDAARAAADDGAARRR